MQRSSAIAISELTGSSFGYTNRTFHPREPPKTMFRVHAKERHGRTIVPCLCLSSENSRATSSNLPPSLNFARASSFLECFSHWPNVSGEVVFGKQPTGRQLTKMCRTLMDVAALSFPLPDSPPSLPLPLPLPAEDDFDGMLIDAEINAATCRFGNMILYAIVSHMAR